MGSLEGSKQQWQEKEEAMQLGEEWRFKNEARTLLYRPEKILEANNTAKSPPWLAIWPSRPAAATCSTVATLPAYPPTPEPPANPTRQFDWWFPKPWPDSPAQVVTWSRWRLASTSGGFHATWTKRSELTSGNGGLPACPCISR